jgi:RNA polymerase sigma factor (sigma-70 family)
LIGERDVPETSFSLLERLRLSSDAAAWQRLVELYTPYVQGWLHRQNVQAADVEDLTQEVLYSVFRALPDFQHDLRRGTFRRWLRTITVNQLRSFWRTRRPQTLSQLRIDAAGQFALDRKIKCAVEMLQESETFSPRQAED